MAKAPDSFTQHAIDLLQQQKLGDVSARSMFGAWCVMLDGSMFAIVDDGKLFLKVSDETKPAFAEAGGEPFTYFHKGKNARVEMSYRAVPGGDLDDRAALAKWARMAAEVVRARGAVQIGAQRARKAKAKAKAKARA